jgi:Zn-dependent peptidase ImmA (M78 family)
MVVIKNNPYKTVKRPISNFFKDDIFLYTSVEDIYNHAQSLGILTVPFDIFSYLKKHSINVFYEDMEDISGYLELKDQIWTVGINKYQNETRQRFTAAHELAHLLFDREIIKERGKHNDFILFRENSSIEELEKRANAFSAELLMPQLYFERIVKSGMNKIEEIAHYFNVSPAATRYRAYKLGYLKGY